MREREAGFDQVALIESSFLFERDWYLQVYPDVAASGGDPLQHYLMHGVAEARNPNRLFDTRWYMSAYLKLGAGRTNPLIHYILYGAELGCDPHPFFSSKSYLDRVEAARGSKLTPLGYYLTRTIFTAPDTFPSFNYYDVAKATQENYRRLEATDIARHIITMLIRPMFIVVVDSHDVQATEDTIASLDRQQYAQFAVVTSAVEALEHCRQADAAPCYVVWLEAGDVLASDALYRYAACVNADPEVDLIYCDYDYKVDAKSFAPVYKPGWSPDYLEAMDYIGSGVCAKLSSARDALAASDSRYDFVLRFVEQPRKVTHLERILVTAPIAGWEAGCPEDFASDMRALHGRLSRTGRQGSITPRVPWARCFDVCIELRKYPRVSIIIPTAAKIIQYDGERVDLITQCVQSIFEVSTYTDFELIIVDNGDFDRSRLAFADRKNVKYVTYGLEEVSIAKKINLGAAYATGELILILNDDVKILCPDWLERLVAHFEKPHVGLVGAKLLYPNGKIQHVGVASCDGHPEHVSRGKPSDDLGYTFSTACVRNYVAITGAVMMTSAEAFAKVGGYSEDFPIDFNDIDFSLKYMLLPASVVYEPNVVLTHYESVSFVKPPRPQDSSNFYAKWGWLANDPLYNEYCLSKHPPSFDVAFSQRRH